MNGRTHYEGDDIFESAYTVKGWKGVAWDVDGWETVPDDDDAEWSGQEKRTGRIVAHMIGDDSLFCFDLDELTPLEREEYCGVCGQIGCCHDGLDRSEATL